MTEIQGTIYSMNCRERGSRAWGVYPTEPRTHGNSTNKQMEEDKLRAKEE